MVNLSNKRKYEIKMIISAIICIVGYIYTYLRPNIFVVILFPIISCAFAVAVWNIYARFVLCRGNKRLQDKVFIRAIKLTMFSPLFIVGMFILLSMPDAPNTAMAISEDALTVVALAIIVIILPLTVMLTLILGAIAFASSVHHLKQTPIEEGALYRKGPIIFTSTVYVLIALSVIGYIISVLS